MDGRFPSPGATAARGDAKLKIKEMGSRYLFICLYLWLEKSFSRGDYRKRETVQEALPATKEPTPQAATRRVF